MRRTTIGKLKEYNMMLRLYGRYFNKFFKYNPDGEEVMDIIAKNIDQLSLDLYAIPTDMLYSKDGNYVGLLFDYLKGYKTIFDKLREHEEFDKDEVARSVLKTVNEFDSIGLDYYDIHDENFMVNDNGDIKVKSYNNNLNALIFSLPVKKKDVSTKGLLLRALCTSKTSV